MINIKLVALNSDVSPRDTLRRWKINQGYSSNDLTGKELMQLKPNSFEPSQVPCDALSAGLYLCRLYYFDQTFETLKLNIVR